MGCNSGMKDNNNVRVQNFSFLLTENEEHFIKLIDGRGKRYIIIIDIITAIMPPSLLGMESKIAEANMKHHSG